MGIQWSHFLSSVDWARDAAIGFDIQGRLLFVVHIEIEATCIRIITARRAELIEEVLYAQ